jgi:hypothetical protein
VDAVVVVISLQRPLKLLYFSDGPHYVSIKPQLNMSNYQAWERAMHRGLGGKNKFQVVDGTIVSSYT